LVGSTLLNESERERDLPFVNELNELNELVAIPSSCTRSAILSI